MVAGATTVLEPSVMEGEEIASVLHIFSTTVSDWVDGVEEDSITGRDIIGLETGRSQAWQVFLEAPASNKSPTTQILHILEPCGRKRVGWFRENWTGMLS